MKQSVQVLALVALTAALLAGTGCNKLLARDQLNKGVQAFKAQKYEDAVNKFQKAIDLDPSLTNARLYLATALAQEFVPGADTPENTKYGSQAIDEFKKVLDGDSKNIPAVKGIASLYFNLKNFDESKKFHRQATELDKNDPEAYYSIAVIDWTQTYKPRMDLKHKLNIGATDPIKDKKACAELKATNGPLVEDGISSLNRALEIRPDYDDAMAYINLLYRERADLQCDDSKARDADIKTANDWSDKTLATRKAKTEKQQNQGGIVMDNTGNLK